MRIRTIAWGRTLPACLLLLTLLAGVAGLAVAPAQAAPGDVLRSWTPAGVTLPWGLGFDGNLWISDFVGVLPSDVLGKEFDVYGNALGPAYVYADGSGHAWWADMSYDAGRGWMSSVNVGGDCGIYSWDTATGTIQDRIVGDFPWTSISQRGLAYRPDDDTFYIGGWNQRILYHIKGYGWDVPGEVLEQFTFTENMAISGLAWNPTHQVIWAATNSTTDTIFQISTAGVVLGTLAHPSPGHDGAGLEMDPSGNLWIIDQDPATVYLIESGLSNSVVAPFDTWVENGELSGEGPTDQAAAGKLNALRTMLVTAQAYIDAGDYAAAVDQLEAALAKCDGDPNPPDFVTGDAADDLAAAIQELIEMLEGV